MAHDVFISHSSKDKAVADAVCAALEAAQHRCWIAPRDVLPGMDWSDSIVDAIAGARVMVLVFSSSSNTSKQVKREVQVAAGTGVAILPFRIEDVKPTRSMLYFTGTQHWLDALSPPLQAHLEKLCLSVAALLVKVASRDSVAIVATARQAAAPAAVPATTEPGPARPAPAVKPPKRATWWPPRWTWKPLLAVCAVVAVLLGIAIIGLLGGDQDAYDPTAPAPTSGTSGNVSTPRPSTSSSRSHEREALTWVDRNCKANMGTLLPDMTETIRETAPRDRTFWAALGSDLTKGGTPYIVCGWNKGFSAHPLTDKQTEKMHLTPTGLSRASGEDPEAPRSARGRAHLSRLTIDNATNLNLKASITGSVRVSTLSSTSGTVALRLGYFTLSGTTCTFHAPDDAIKAGQTVNFSFNPIMEPGDEGPPVKRPFVVFVDLCDIIDLPDEYYVLSDSLSQLVDGD